jgi:single-stranded DNA-binding protein
LVIRDAINGRSHPVSTTVTFADHLADDPELGYTREGNKPFVSFRVLVNHRYQNAQEEWLEEEPTPHDVRVYGGAANNVADSFGSSFPAWPVERRKRAEKAMISVVAFSYLLGMSTGGWRSWSKQLGITRLSKVCR